MLAQQIYIAVVWTIDEATSSIGKRAHICYPWCHCAKL